MKNLYESVTELFMGLMMVAILATVVIFLVVIAVVGFLLFMYLKRKYDHLTKIEYAQPRLFTAPVQTQWQTTWDYLLYKLEDTTGLTFTMWPEQIFAGCLILSIGGGLVIGMFLTLLNPNAGAQWLVLSGGVGALIGLLTAKSLTQPFDSLFGGGGGSGDDDNDSGSLGSLLGIEDE